MTGPWPAAGADRQPILVAGRTILACFATTVNRTDSPVMTRAVAGPVMVLQPVA